MAIYLDGANPLRFVKQPEDVTVQEGEDEAFEVEVTGGTRPCAYQGQVWDSKHGFLWPVIFGMIGLQESSRRAVSGRAARIPPGRAGCGARRWRTAM